MIKLALQIAIMLFVPAILSSCGRETSCKDGKILIDVKLLGAAASATSLEISVAVDGQTLVASTPHKPGAAEGVLEVLFETGYPRGATVVVMITANGPDGKFSGFSAATKLEDSCERLEISVGENTEDIQGADHGADLTSSDLAQSFDMAQSDDLAAPVDGDSDAPDLSETISTDLSGADLWGTTALSVSLEFLGGATGSVGVNSSPSQPVSNCNSGVCTNHFATGTSVTLIPIPGDGYYFGGWTGDCAGLGECTVSLNSATVIGAVFSPANRAFLLRVPKTPTELVALGSGSTNLDKIATGADAACQAEATDATLPGTFVAWIATASQTVSQHMQSSSPGAVVPNGWIGTDGKVFADDPYNGKTFYPIMHEANGAKYDAGGVNDVLTGSELNGGPSSQYDCDDWGALTSGQVMTTLVGYGGGEWNTAFTSSCASAYRLFCFQVDYRVAVKPPLVMGLKRRVFTAYPFDTKSGIAGADSLCDNRAISAGLTSTAGNFAAVLAPNSSSSPASRFTVGDLPVVRTDDVIVAMTVSDFFASPTDWLAPPDVSADGSSYGAGLVAIGANNLSSVGNQNCANWNSDMGNGLQVISADKVNPSTLGARSCGLVGVICLEK